MTPPGVLILFALARDTPALDAGELRLEGRDTSASRFELDAPNLAGRALRRHRWTSQLSDRRSDASPARDEGGTCEISCRACRESDQQARDVLRRRRLAIGMHRAFAVAAWGSMLVTEVFGTIAALNQDTWFGQGPCATGRPDEAILGSYGCSGIRGVHLSFAFLTTGLYATAGVLAATAPDPERVSEGYDTHARRLRVHRALTWVHATGMILMPILGVLSSNPQMIYGDGADSANSRADFARAMRSVHQIVGYTTFTAYSVAAIFGFM